MDDDAIRDLFRSLSVISIRRMFGGKGIYSEGRIVALEVDGGILLKADDASAPRFREAGSRQWVYSGHRDRAPVAMPYWSIPDDALDDQDAMDGWARLAFEAAGRAPKPPASGRKRKLSGRSS